MDLKILRLDHGWMSVQFWEDYQEVSNLTYPFKFASFPSRQLLTDKPLLDLEINLPFAVLQYWQEAGGRINKPMTTSNSKEYPVLLSSQEMLAIKRLQIRICLAQIFWNSNWPDRKQTNKKWLKRIFLKSLSTNWNWITVKGLKITNTNKWITF